MAQGTAGEQQPLQQWIGSNRREWWRRYRWLALLLILAVWLHVLLQAVAHGWNALDALVLGFGGT